MDEGVSGCGGHLFAPINPVLHLRKGGLIKVLNKVLNKVLDKVVPFVVLRLNIHQKIGYKYIYFL